MKFHDLTDTTAVCRVVAPFCLVDTERRFRKAYCFQRQGDDVAVNYSETSAVSNTQHGAATVFIISPVAAYGCETSSLTVIELRLGVI
jgi:hypothetical protein